MGPNAASGTKKKKRNKNKKNGKEDKLQATGTMGIKPGHKHTGYYGKLS
jgi:hypothetical protein